MNADANPIALLDALDPDRLQERLAELDAERSAVRVLLNVARARRRGRRKTPPPAAGESQEGRTCLA